MRSLIRRAGADAAPNDPAPSLLAYRLERLLLSPLIRAFLRRGLPVFAVVMIVGIVVADERRRNAFSDMVAQIRTELANRPEFRVGALRIDGASDPLARRIRETLPLHFPVSSFDLDLDALRETVLALDPVAEAQLQIAADGVLRLSLVERRPAVIWRGPEGLRLYDAEGHVAGRIAHRGERPDLPLIAGAGAETRIAEALRILAVLAPLNARLRGLTRVGERRWDVILDRGQRIMLPEAAPVAALEQVMALDQAQDILDRDIAVIDMRLPRRPTLRLAEGARAALDQVRLLQAGGVHE